MLKQKIQKLEELINKLESPHTDLDDAFELHAGGLKIIEELDQDFEKAKQRMAEKG